MKTDDDCFKCLDYGAVGFMILCGKISLSHWRDKLSPLPTRKIVM